MKDMLHRSKISHVSLFLQNNNFVKLTFQELTETEVELYENQIDFPTFIELLTRHFCIGKAEEDLHKAFQVFDREDSGIISENELRYALTNLGNVMSLSEVDDLLDGVRVGPQGSVSYSSLVNKLDE